MIQKQKVFISLLAIACSSLGAFGNENIVAPPAQSGGGQLVLPKLAAAEDPLVYSLTAGWTSKYVTEGIDCLPGSSIWEVAPSVAYKNWTLSGWYASGVSENYEELDMVLSHAFELGDWTITPWYEHQFYFSTDDNVANPAVTVAYALNDWLTLGSDLQWKVEHQRMEGYYDVFAQAEWNPFENATIAALVRYGYNSGYNVSVDDGANCIDYSLKATYQWTENLSFSALVSFSQAASVLKRTDLGDEFAYGFYVNMSF